MVKKLALQLKKYSSISLSDSDKSQFGPWDIRCREAMLNFKTWSRKKEYVDFILLQKKMKDMEQNNRKCDNRTGINYANEI